MVIVGPGYGGAVAAVRLAQNGIQVCVLERGKEYLPGDFPSQFGPLVVSAQIHIPKNERPIGPQDGLFHVETGQGISALVGCALGGTSQINAGVVAAPEEQIFEGSHWPTSFVKDRLDYFKKVKTMLGANPHPSASKLPKVQALQRLAEGVNLGERFSAPDIAVTFKDGLNGAGFKQFKCMECQGALLRFLNDKTYRPLGSDRLHQAHVRIVVATNCNLSEHVKQHLFREDLWYRLKKLILHLPPLRERRDDIELLADYFGNKLTRNEAFLKARHFDDAMRCWMRQYSWPGNVRELESVVYQWLAGVSLDAIEEECGSEGVSPSPAEDIGLAELKQGLRSAQMDWQRRYLLCLHNTASGVISEAARIAQIDRSALRRLFQKHGIVSPGKPRHAALRDTNCFIYPASENYTFASGIRSLVKTVRRDSLIRAYTEVPAAE